MCIGNNFPLSLAIKINHRNGIRFCLYTVQFRVPRNFRNADCYLSAECGDLQNALRPALFVQKLVTVRYLSEKLIVDIPSWTFVYRVIVAFVLPFRWNCEAFVCYRFNEFNIWNFIQAEICLLELNYFLGKNVFSYLKHMSVDLIV